MDRSPCTRILMINSSSSGVHRTRSLLPSIPGVFIIASRSGKPTGVPMAKATDGFALVEGVDIAVPPAANGVPASAAIVAHPLSLKGSDDASRPASEVSRPSSCVMFPSSPSCVVNPKLAAAAAKASSASGNIASGPSGQKWLSCQIGWSFGYADRFTRSAAACSICASARLTLAGLAGTCAANRRGRSAAMLRVK